MKSRHFIFILYEMGDPIKEIIDSCLKTSPCTLEMRFNEPMSSHTTFKAGGAAACWLRPSGDGFPAFTAALIDAATREGVPLFFLGGGANILVADEGVGGIVLDTGGWTGEVVVAESHCIEFRAGTTLDDAAEAAAAKGLSGLEFLAGMPGSVGGALWMNARAYDCEIADVLAGADLIDFTDSAAQQIHWTANKAEFSYKCSPFQKRRCLILSARFALQPSNEQEIRAKMDTHRKDRESKGHYRYPSAGSVFKNNREWGKPTGQIIDELGMKGLRKGGAQIAPYHANIIVNVDSAKAADIRTLIDETAAKVKAATGFVLEPEILFVGSWPGVDSTCG